MKHSILKQVAIALTVLTSLSSSIALVPAASVSAKNSTATNTCVYRVYRNGDMNQKCVGYIQKMLNSANNARLAVDNDYGPRTAAAVKTWQKKMNDTHQGAQLYVDGVTGEQTWATLCIHRSQYKSLAKAAGCNRWNDEINAYLSGSNGKQTATTTSKKKAAKTCDQQTFSRSGSKRNHHCVRYLQNMLNMATGSNLDTTAPYGSATRTAVKAFQSNHNVKNDSPGSVGKHTWAELCHYHAANASDQRVYNGLKEKAGCGN